MRRSLLSLCTALGVSLSCATDAPPVVFPTLPAAGASVQALVPRGWVIEKRLNADFNGDHMADTLLVLRMNDPRNLLRKPAGFALGAWPLNTNPRLLVGAFGQRSGGYRLAFQSRVIPRHEEATMSDPFEALNLRPGGFSLLLTEFFSAGSWTESSVIFTVRFQDGCFRVIGYDRTTHERNTGRTDLLSVNFLTGRQQEVFSSWTADMREQRSERWSAYPGPRRVCLEQVTDGLKFLRE
ncbi:hypothetical protein [Deinococcus multiflagellatus]|uniref:Lipoprotein n=1 Tax=Deinococcus multiflagellatus TaxID=1656887 RepID=A0ABW1ZGA8_9DEIO|nr:hypothetical protein [Deinococcus multiflagellatus]MBZ9712046.1 hypothetical protein [Deinococcus multiflagellatus]